MGARTRSRNRSSVFGGTIVYNGTATVNGGSGVSDREVTDDVTMAKPYVVDHPLTITRTRVDAMLRINGVVPYNPSTGSGSCVFTDFNPQNRALYQYAPALPSFDATYWRTKALANINPYRPTWNVPLFLWELKDMPRMLKQAGDWLKLAGKKKPIHLGPDAILAWELGWSPLISDLLSLFDLAKDIDDRVAYLKALDKGTRIRRRLLPRTKTDTSWVPNGYQVTIPYRVCYQADVWNETFEEVWFTVNAVLQDTPLPNDDASLRTLSQDIVLGLKFEPYHVWDYIPWTWLIDYFSNVGDFMEAQNGLVHMKVTRMNLMATRSRSSKLIRTYIEGGLTSTPSVLSQTKKHRFVYANPHPGFAADPFLTGRQLAILGSLLMSRNRGVWSSAMA